jgi:hypothetical protein
LQKKRIIYQLFISLKSVRAEKEEGELVKKGGEHGQF